MEVRTWAHFGHLLSPSSSPPPPGDNVTKSLDFKSLDLSRLGGRLLAAPKNIKEWAPPKTIPNPKSRALGRPRLRFWSTLDDLFVQCFAKFLALAKTLKLQQV